MRSLSRIIKATFQQIPVNQYDVREVPEASSLLPPKSFGKASPALAILDASAIMEAARTRAAELLKEARKEATRIVEEGVKQAEAAREVAWQEGFEAGHQAGYEEGLAAGKAEAEAALRGQFADQMNVIASIVEEARKARAEAVAAAEADILTLSIAIAEKIVKREVEEDPDLTFRVVADVVRRLQGRGRTCIRVHPSVKTAVEELQDELLSASEGITNLEFVADTSIEPGGCVIETEFGRLDARLETRFLDVSQSLLQLLRGGISE